MKVFLSWSGELSKKVAGLMNDWISNVLQGTEGWYSPDDIGKGAIWFNEIADNLSDTSFGIIFCSKENLNAPWLLFETGCLSKGLSKNLVSPFLIDLKPSDLHPPLSQFNVTTYQKGEVLKLLKEINKCNKNAALDEGRLNSSFEKWWPDFEGPFQKILEGHKTTKPIETRTTGEYLEEILLNTRAILSDSQRNNVAQIETIFGKRIRDYPAASRISEAILRENQLVKDELQKNELNSARAVFEAAKGT